MSLIRYNFYQNCKALRAFSRLSAISSFHYYYYYTIKDAVQTPECAVVNLHDSIGPDAPWVCYFDNFYIDPFRMPPPIEVVKYIKDIQYNDIQYQDTKSVLCGYYCLYFLKRLDGYKS